MKKVAKATLHFLEPGHDGIQVSGNCPHPMSEAWITDDLVLYTQQVWAKVYGRVISTSEAVEMLLNVKRLVEVLMKVDMEG